MNRTSRENAMRGITLTTLMSYPAVYLAPLLREAGMSPPLESKMCNGASIPNIFPLEDMAFAEA